MEMSHSWTINMTGVIHLRDIVENMITLSSGMLNRERMVCICEVSLSNITWFNVNSHGQLDRINCMMIIPLPFSFNSPLFISSILNAMEIYSEVTIY